MSQLDGIIMALEATLVSLSPFTALLREYPWPWLLLPSLILAYLLSVTSMQLLGPKVPLAGIHSIFEPRMVGTWRFFKRSDTVIDEGYSYVRTLITLFIFAPIGS